ncbi:MAG: hypothetical protein DRG78_19550 [Epsilonproteobacteria bacterium]|nr:MAG: hypothetical protein DRG78_19550 [Campylobacterota bacterium]
MKLNKKIFIQILVLSLLNIGVYAKEITVSNVKNLKGLIDIALENNLDIKVAKSNIDAKDAGITYASSGYLPQVSVQGDVSQYHLQSKTAHSSDDDMAIGVNASANQLLYDFGETSSGIDSAKGLYAASLKRLDSTVNEVVFSVKNAYYNILNQKQLINVAKESIKIDELQLEQAEAYFKAGVRTKIDVTNAQLKVSNSKLSLLKAEFELESAHTKLISILGVKLDKDFSIQKNEKDIIDLANSILPLNEDASSLVKMGLKQRAEIDESKANIEVAQSNYTLANSQYYPKIFLNATYDEKETDIASLNNRQISAGVYITWDVFSGYSTEAKVRENLAGLQKSKVDLKNIELKISEEIINAYLEVKKGEDSTKIQILSLELATQNLSLAQQRYKAGLSDMVELNDAKFDYTKSKSDLVNSYYAYLISVANLEYQTGKR